MATLRSDPATTASYLLTVTPGFVQVLTPETASLTPGATVQVKGQIAEINSGSIHWTLATTPGGEVDPGDSYGSISETRCSHSSPYLYLPAPRPIPPRALCLRAVRLSFWWGWRREIPTPPQRFTFC